VLFMGGRFKGGGKYEKEPEGGGGIRECVQGDADSKRMQKGKDEETSKTASLTDSSRTKIRERKKKEGNTHQRLPVEGRILKNGRIPSTIEVLNKIERKESGI